MPLVALLHCVSHLILLSVGLISAFLSLFLFSQSMVAFLKDPTGAPLWEENPEAKDVVHVETEKVSFNECHDGPRDCEFALNTGHHCVWMDETAPNKGSH